MTTPTPPATGLDAQDLLRRHLAGEDVSDVLSELAGSDPSLAPVLSLLAKRREDAQEPDDDSDPADAPGRRAAEYERHRLLVESVSAQVDSLTEDLARMQQTFDELAGALGACPVCLGDNPACQLCHGRGGPGWIPPQPAAFVRYVVPAIRAHQYARARGPRPANSTATERTGT
jgi:hypothetical protein